LAIDQPFHTWGSFVQRNTS